MVNTTTLTAKHFVNALSFYAQNSSGRRRLFFIPILEKREVRSIRVN